MGSVADKRSNKPTKSRANRLDENYRFINERMAEDDKLTAAIAKVLLRAMPADYTRCGSGCPRPSCSIASEWSRSFRGQPAYCMQISFTC